MSNGMITSLQNPKIKWVRKLITNSRFRRQEEMFVVEGVRMAEEALKAGWTAQLVLFTNALNQRGKQLLTSHAFSEVAEEVSPAILRSISDTETPQGILVVLEVKVLTIPKPLDFVLVPDVVRDPGNLGAILRTASAAGVQAVVIPPETVDPYSPKVTRSAMGAHFRLPIPVYPWDDIEDLFRENQLTVLLASSGEGVEYTRIDLGKPVAWIIGGEAAGASPQALRLVRHKVHIPMQGEVESLNAAAAAAVLLFETVRQRKGKTEV